MDNEKTNRLRDIISFWKNNVLSKGLFSRDLSKKINVGTHEVIDIVGVRRSGKSSVLNILAKNLNDNDLWLYVNFEDPYFTEDTPATIIEDIINVYLEHFSEKLSYLFL